MSEISKDAAQDGTFRPIIFVGAGSTGAKIVSRIQARLSQSSDPLIRTFVQYVNITSETRAEPGVLSGVPRRSLATEQNTPRKAIDFVSKLVSNTKQQSEFREWWHMENGQYWIPRVPSCADGCAGIRPLGRLMLHAKASLEQQQDALIGSLRGIAQNIWTNWAALPPVEKPSVDIQENEKNILCFVVGSLAGGTCSGMVLDLPLFLRQAWGVLGKRESWFTAQINGIFLLGDVCYLGAATGEQNWLQRNLQIDCTKYALAELFFTSTATGRKICAPNWVSQVGVEAFATQAFREGTFYDEITLVGAKNDSGRHFRRFESYCDFVADFYTSMLESKALNSLLGRRIDEQGSMVNSLESASPAEPHNFARIGRLGLRPPTGKWRMILREKISDAVSKQLKNTDVDRDDELIEEFKTRTGSNTWSELLAPPEVTIQSPEPLPKKKDEHHQHWKDQKASIESHFSSFIAWPQEGVLNQSLVDLVRQVKECLVDIAMNTLGQRAGRGFNLGSLSYFEKTLDGWISERLTELTSKVATLQANISGKGEGGSNLNQRFEEILLRETEDFPEDGLFNKFRRKTWSGNDDLTEALRQYAQALRELRAAEREIAVLRLAQSEVQKIQIFTKLLGPACFETFKSIRAATAREFEEEKNRPEIWIEVLRDRESIERILVDPLLRQPSDNGDSSLDALTKRALAEWSSGAKAQIMTAWDLVQRTAEAKKKMEQGGSVSLPSLEQMAQFDGVQERLGSVGADLNRCISESINSVVHEKIMARTVWDVLGAYVRELAKERGESCDIILQKLFRDYAQRASCFGKISSEAPQMTPHRPKVICIGNAKAAKKCFSDLGIDQPDYLSTLLANTFGESYSLAEPATREGEREFAIFIFRQGSLPVYTEGFTDAVDLLMPQDGVDELNWRWSDRRFPQWINEWWKLPNKPDYLNR